MARFFAMLASVFGPAPTAAADMPDFAAGQVWRYETRPGEEASRLTIVKIDQDPRLGPIYHIRLDHLIIPNRQATGGVLTHLQHAPISGEALAASVVDLVDSPPPADPGEGYRTWRQAFDAGKGGIFTIPVSRIVQFIEDSANSTR